MYKRMKEADTKKVIHCKLCPIKNEGVHEMAKEKRFVKVYSQGTADVVTVLIDKETGVNYVAAKMGYAGGLTVLLDQEGKPVITPKNEIPEK